MYTFGESAVDGDECLIYKKLTINCKITMSQYQITKKKPDLMIVIFEYWVKMVVLMLKLIMKQHLMP